MTITIDEAIDELQNQCCVPNSVFLTPEYQARALGIEALKYIKRSRGFGEYPVNRLLPGEAEG